MNGRLLMGLLGGGAMLLLGGLMASCTPDTTAPRLQPRSSSVAAEQPTGVPATANLPPTEVWLEPFTDYACLECHGDQQKLTELALPDEPKESLSEGPG